MSGKEQDMFFNNHVIGTRLEGCPIIVPNSWIPAILEVLDIRQNSMTIVGKTGFHSDHLVTF